MPNRYLKCIDCEYNKGKWGSLNGAYPCGLTACIKPDDDISASAHTAIDLQNNEEREMKIEINFTPPESCNICKWAKYKNHQFKHCCLIFDKQIPDYRTGGRLEECKERANQKNKDCKNKYEVEKAKLIKWELERCEKLLSFYKDKSNAYFCYCTKDKDAERDRQEKINMLKNRIEFCKKSLKEGR